MSLKRRSWIDSSERRSTIMREASRGFAGCFAMRFRGRGYLKSESFIEAGSFQNKCHCMFVRDGPGTLIPARYFFRLPAPFLPAAALFFARSAACAAARRAIGTRNGEQLT